MILGLEMDRAEEVASCQYVDKSSQLRSASK